MALTRKKFLVAKIESTYGIDPVLSGGSDAIQVTNVEVTPIESDNVQAAAFQGFYWWQHSWHLGGPTSESALLLM
jgi:hypothetical protein